MGVGLVAIGSFSGVGLVANSRPIDAVRIFFLLTNFSAGLRIFLMELSKKNP